MPIAVTGTGNAGGTLGSRWRAAGHDVVFGSRSGSGAGPGGAPIRPTADALADAEVVVLAVPAGAVGDLITANAADSPQTGHPPWHPGVKSAVCRS